MIRLLCGVLFLLGLSLNVFAAQNPVATGPEPAWTVKTQFRDKATAAKNEASEGYLILLSDEQMHVGEETRFRHYTRKITTKAGVQYGSEISVSYDPDYQKLLFHRITIYRDGKPLNRLNPSEFKVLREENEREKFIYNNNRTAIITLADVRIGDVIDYSFSVIGANPIHPKYADFFRLSTSEPLDQLLVRVLMPANRPLQHKVYNTKQQMQVKQLGNLLEYSWQGNQIPGYSLEDNTPSWYSAYAYAWVSEYTSWAQVNDWALTLYSKLVSKNKELTEKIAQIKAADGSDEGRLRSALAFVQNEVRYLGNEGGIYGYQPNDPAKVFAQRYGDCKDKAWLLCHMLGQMQIKAYPVLVNTSLRKHVAQELPSPYSFDHCVVKVELLGKTLWYDATMAHQEGTYDNIFFPRYEAGLVVKPGTKGFTTIPVFKNSKVQLVDEYTLGGIEDEVFYHVESNYYGSEADYVRAQFAATSQQEIEKNYLNFYASFFPAIAQESEFVFNDQADANRFTTYESYKISDFWQESEGKKEKYWTANIYPYTLYSRLELPSTRIRKMPLALEYPYEYDHTIKVRVPSHWNVKDAEVEVKDKSVYYKQTTTYDAENKTITLHFTFRTLQDHVPAADVKAYFSAVKKIKEDMGFELTNTMPLETTPTEDGVNWFSICLVLLSLGVGGYGAYRLYQYDPAPAVDYRHHPRDFGGWLVLVMIGLSISPVRLVFGIINGEWISFEVWNRLNDAESAFHNPFAAWVMVLTILYNLLFLSLTVLVVVLFYQKRSSLPKVVTIFYVVSFLGQVGDAYAVFALGGEMNQMYSAIGKTLITAVIWIPYFHLSTRVKETFICRLNPEDEMDEPPTTWPADALTTVEEQLPETAVVSGR